MLLNRHCGLRVQQVFVVTESSQREADGASFGLGELECGEVSLEPWLHDEAAEWEKCQVVALVSTDRRSPATRVVPPHLIWLQIDGVALRQQLCRTKLLRELQTSTWGKPTAALHSSACPPGVPPSCSQPFQETLGISWRTQRRLKIAKQPLMRMYNT